MDQSFSKTALFLVLGLGSAITLFCTPLILRYRFYKEYTVSLTATDSVAVNKRMSSVWCAGQELKMNSTFDAYLLPAKPPLAEHPLTSVFEEHVTLHSGATEVWGFFLIEGSILKVSICPKMPGAAVTIVKGKDTLMACLEYHLLHLNDVESMESSESSETDEGIDDKDETHESTVSSSEGVNSSEIEGHEFECKGALKRKEYKTVSHCFRSHLGPDDANQTRQFDDVMKLHATNTDRYYVVFSSSHMELDPIRQPFSNEIYARFDLERVVYNVSTAYDRCNHSTSCNFEVSFGDKGFVVVQYPANASESAGLLTSDVLTSFCQPRKGLYFCFYLLLFLVIFVCAFQ